MHSSFQFLPSRRNYSSQWFLENGFGVVFALLCYRIQNYWKAEVNCVHVWVSEWDRDIGRGRFIQGRWEQRRWWRRRMPSQFNQPSIVTIVRPHLTPPAPFARERQKLLCRNMFVHISTKDLKRSPTDSHGAHLLIPGIKLHNILLLFWKIWPGAGSMRIVISSVTVSFHQKFVSGAKSTRRMRKRVCDEVFASGRNIWFIWPMFGADRWHLPENEFGKNNNIHIKVLNSHQ